MCLLVYELGGGLLLCEINPNYHLGHRGGWSAPGQSGGHHGNARAGQGAAVGWIMENNRHGSRVELEVAMGPEETARPEQGCTGQRRWNRLGLRCSP